MLDLQSYVENSVKASRAKALADSDQLTLGEMILKCEAIEKSVKSEDSVYVKFDFEYLFPTRLNSWRGIYAELALNFVNEESEKEKPLSITEFTKLLKGAVGKTYHGYKGGDFQMSRQTPVWVANYGNSGNTAVIDIVSDGYGVIIVTAYRNS